MLRFGLFGALAATAFVAIDAHAEDVVPPVRNAPAPYVYEPAPEPPPLGHRGFQAAVRSGISFPVGSAASHEAMARYFGVQIPIFLEAGFKPDPHVFIGAYGSFAFGGVSDRFDVNPCSGHDCSAHAFHVGAEVQYHADPSARADPWVGYGIGYEWVATSGSVETTFRGPEYGRSMAGLDLRLSRDFGIGPFVDVTIARYTDVTAAEIDSTSAHGWVTVGGRLVLLP